MLAPFDGVEVHALLDELPQRAQLAEERHALLHGLEHVVDFGVSGETTNTETDTGVSALVTVTKSTQDIRRLKRRRGASRAGRQGNILESHQEGFALYVGERDVDAARVVLGRVSVEGGVLHCEQAIGETLRKLSDALGIVLVVMSANTHQENRN